MMKNSKFLLIFFDDARQAFSVYYQIIFNTVEHCNFYNFIIVFERDELTRLNALT